MHSTALRAVLLSLLALPACAPASRVSPAAPAPATSAASAPAAAGVPVTQAYRAAVARGTRNADGSPGPRYWTQRVRYSIQAELDPASTVLTGRERITYHNRSPDTL
ncbi:MAG TPA: hypothetical protein VFH27_06930, partial [Longimicrobiaceae bacterium]|nr:hypothetical protein [Longimicrobiaceae bacterium]